MSKKFSIIVPCYNSKNHIEKLFSMLHSKLYKDYEVVFVDDCSLDGTYQQMCELKQQGHYDNFRILQTVINSGPGPARNLAIQHARGEYVLFCDSDDWFDINSLVKIEGFLADHADADLIVFPHEIVRKCKKNLNDAYFQYKDGDEVSRSSVLMGCAAPWAKLYKTEIIKHNNVFFPTRMTGEDLCFLVYYTVYVRKAYKMDFSFYHYVMNENSITHKKVTEIQKNTTFELLHTVYHEYFPEIEIERFVNTHLLTKAKMMTAEGESCREIRRWFKEENKRYPNWLSHIDLRNQSCYRKMIYKAMYRSRPMVIKLVMGLRRKLY